MSQLNLKLLVRQLRPAVVALAIFTLVAGVLYPMAVTGFSQVFFDHRADGSIITRDGVAVGSELIGQSFTRPEYFHPRPSAAGSGYDGAASSGSNLGPNNEDLLTAVTQRVAAYRTENGLTDTALVPVDAVTSSGSGLDPEISVANARLQAPRVAAARGVPVDVVLGLVEDHTIRSPLGFLGDAGVTVLQLNIALDDLGR